MLSDQKLGALVRKALAAEGYVIRRAMPRSETRQWPAAAKLASGITVERLQGRHAWMQGKSQLSPEDNDGTQGCDEWMRGWEEMDAVRREYPPGECCHGDRDGDCHFSACPQNRDGEAHKTGRHCPLYRVNMRAEEDEG